MDLDQLSNEELDALAATDIMGWHRELLAGGWAYLKSKPDESVDTIADSDIAMWANDWHPTAEGNEHQAMMVVRKMQEDEWKVEILMLGLESVVTFYRFRPGEVMPQAKDKEVGRALTLAALTAVRGQHAS